jgi:ATP-binding cassette subfamily B protein
VRRRWLVAVVLCGLLQAACGLGIAVLMQRTLDGMLSGSAPLAALPLLASFAGLAALAGGARWLERFLGERLGQHYVHELRLVMFSALTRMAPEERSAEGRGTVPLRFMTDLDALRHWISLGQARLLVALVLLVATLAYLATLHLFLALLVLALLGAGAGASIGLGRRLELAIREARTRRGRLANRIADRTANLSAVVGFGRVGTEARQLARQSHELCDAQTRRAFWVGGLRGTAELTVRSAMAAVPVAGLLAPGSVTPGSMLAAVSLVALLTGPLRDLGRVHEYWTAARVSRGKLAEFVSVSAGPGTRRNRTIRDPHGTVHVEGLVLHRGQAPFEVTLQPGARVLVAGANGAGKTTLLWTLAGIRRAFRGRVRIDGRSAHRLDRVSLQHSVGIGSVDLPLMKGSLRMNLRYRAPEATDAELEAVCRKTGLVGRLAPWPELLELRLQDGGANLSPGERMRVQLARALLGQPRVLLLDELDSLLDAEGRTTFRALLADYPGTVIFTSRDPSTGQLAEQVWTLSSEGIAATPEAQRPDARTPAAEAPDAPSPATLEACRA